MAKQIIILERINPPSDLSFRCLFWIAIPTVRQSFYANPAAKSAWSGASAAENLSLQNGEFIEKSDNFNYPTGTPIATIQADLVAKFTAVQTYYTNVNPWVRHGSFYDGISWTLGGVA